VLEETMAHNRPERIDLCEMFKAETKTVSTDTELERRMKLLRTQGEVAFGMIAQEMNQLPPGRKRTEDEFEQVCIALALFLDYLLSNSQG
jgi:hypothetical protein